MIAVNQQLDVTCTNCGWAGRRYKIINRPCPRCGRATVVFGTKSSQEAKVKAEVAEKLAQTRAEAEAFLAETTVSAKPNKPPAKRKRKAAKE